MTTDSHSEPAPAARSAARLGRDAETIELYSDFLSESSDGVSRVEEILLDVQRAAGSAEQVHELFRVFHEPDHFQLLGAEVKRAVGRGVRRLRVWCAAAATGEEPYTLAITLAEALQGTQTDFRILATDLSRSALEVAARCRYEQQRLAQVPAGLRQRYFRRESSAGGEARYGVVPELRERLVFGQINLAFPPFPLRGELHVIFCRNVMIYFDAAVRARRIEDRTAVRAERPGHRAGQRPRA